MDKAFAAVSSCLPPAPCRGWPPLQLQPSCCFLSRNAVSGFFIAFGIGEDDLYHL